MTYDTPLPLALRRRQERRMRGFPWLFALCVAVAIVELACVVREAMP
jgi:hypothetical protein